MLQFRLFEQEKHRYEGVNRSYGVTDLGADSMHEQRKINYLRWVIRPTLPALLPRD